MESIDLFSSGLIPAEKILVYNSIILPRRVQPCSEYLINTFSPFFDLFSQVLIENPCVDLINFEKFGKMQETLKKWNLVQNDEVLEPLLVNDTLSNLKPGESFPLYIKSQNCCLIFNKKNDGSNMVVSAFQVNASNQEIIEGKSQLYLNCPSMTVKVKNESLLKSNKFSELLADLANNRNETCLMYTQVKEDFIEELNDIDLPFLIFEWILPLITENNVPITDRVFIVKKYNDSVVFLENQIPFRRSPIWISIKSYFHLRLVEILGADHGRIVFKVIMLQVHFLLCRLFEPSDLEKVFECLKKTGKRLKKLEDLAMDNQLIQNICIEGKKLINIKRQESEEIYLNHVLSLEKNLKIKKFKFNKLDSIPYDEIRIFLEKLQEINDRSHFYEHQVKPLPKRFNRLEINANIPNPGIFRNCNETELKDLILDFEIWVKSSLEIESTILNEYEIEILFDLLHDYVVNSLKMYQDDPIGYSTLVLTSFKLVAIIDQNACLNFNLLSQHKIGLDIKKFSNLLLPTSSDVTQAKEIIDYYNHREKAEKSALINLPEKKDTEKPANVALKTEEMNSETKKEPLTENFGIRFFNQCDLCKFMKNKLIEQQEQLIKKHSEIAMKMSGEYKRLKQEYDSRKCTQKQTGSAIDHDNEKCRKCFLYRKMKKMTLDVFEKFLPEDELEIELVIFEICIPRIIASLRDAIILVRHSVLDLKSTGKKVQGLWLDRSQLSKHNKKYQKIVKLGSSYKSYRESHKKYKDIKFNLEDPSSFIVNCEYNLKLCAFDSVLEKPSSKNLLSDKSCRFVLESKHKSLQWIMDDDDISENKIIAEINKCPIGVTINEYRNFGFFKTGSNLILLRILEALETRSLPFREVSTCYLVTQSLWKLNGLNIKENENSKILCPETQILFSNNYFLNQLYNSLKEFFLNNQHNWGEHLLSYIVVIIALRYIHFSSIHHYTMKMIDFLKEVRKTLILWQEKMENMINSDTSSKKSVKKNLRSKLLQISCIYLLTYCTESEYFHMSLSSDQDFLYYLKSFNNIRNLTVAGNKKINFFENFLVFLVKRFCLKLEKNIKNYVEDNQGSPLRLYLKNVYSNKNDQKFNSFKYSPEHYGFFVTFNESSFIITEIFIGLDGKFLVNGLAYSRLPDYIKNESLYQSYFKNTDFKAYSIENAFETEPKKFDNFNSYRYQFKMLDSINSNQQNKILIVTEFKDNLNENKISILLSSYYFYGFLPKYFIDNFSHWIDTKTMRIEFRGKNFESLKLDEAVKYFFDVHTNEIEEYGTGRLLVMKNSSYFRDFYFEIFYRLEEEEYTHIFFNEYENNFYFEFPRHSLTFSKQADSPDILSKEYIGYKISPSQNINTLFGFNCGLLLEETENLKNPKKKLIIPNGSYKLNESKLHQTILHDFTIFNNPSYFSYELDERLQILKGEESIESWLLLAYLHAITSSILPDPFLGRQGTARSLEILQSGHCFSCSPLSKESLRILELISELSPKRQKINRLKHQIQKVDWPKGLISSAASDLFTLLSNEIIYKSARLHFLYPEYFSTDGKIDQNKSNLGISWLEKELYLNFYHKEINEDYKLTSSFEEDIVKKNSKDCSDTGSFIGENFEWVSTNIINIRKVSTQSYSPSKRLNLLKDFESLKNFKGLSSEPLDFTKMSNLVLISKDLFNYWIDLYNFSKTAPKESLIITLTGLAYLKVDLDHLLLFQKISNFPEMTKNLETTFSDQYSKIDDFLYKKEKITEVLKKNIKITSEDNPQKSKMNYGESRKQFIARTVHLASIEIERIIVRAESFIRDQWPNKTIKFYDDRFKVKKVQKEVFLLFSNWFKHLELRKLFEYLNNKVNNCYYLYNNTPIESEYQRPQIEIKTKPFSINFEVILCNNIIKHEEFQEISTIYNQGLIPNENLVSFIENKPPILSEFPFKPEDSNALNSYFISDLKKSWDHHISSQNSSKTLEKDKNLKLKLQNLASLYKMKSSKLHLLLKSSIPEKSSYLKDSFLLPSFPSCKVLSLLRLSHEKREKFSNSQSNPSTLKHLQVPNPIEVLCGAICIYWALEQRVLRCLFYYSQEVLHEASLTRELETFPFSNWKPKDYPLWLILQVETDMMIRAIQVDVAEAMIRPPSDKNTVMQLNMGEGKTSLIIPMVVLVLGNKSQLVRLTVLKSLFNMNKNALVYKLGGFLNRRVYSVPCKRDLKFEKSGINLVNQVLKECLNEQGVFLTIPDQRFSFVLKGMELSRIPETSDAGNCLLNLQSILDKKSRDLLDESDEILNPKYQLLYTIGKQNTVQGGRLRWTLCQAVLETMQEHLEDLSRDFKDSVVFERFCDEQGFPDFKRFPLVRLLNDEPYRKLCELIAQSVLWGNTREINFPELRSSELFDQVFRYVTSETVTIELTKQVFIIFKNNPSQLDAVILLKGILSCQILLSCLMKRWRVNFGVNTKKMYLMQAVPFRAKDVPADKSQFAHPDVAILLTQLSYFYSGLSTEQLDQVFNRLNHDPEGSREYESWIDELSQLNIFIDPSVKTFQGVNLNDKQQKLEILFPLLKFNQRVINYWLNHFLYPKEAKQFEGKLSLSFWDLCIQKPLPMTGFSGTNDSKILLPLSVENFDVPGLIGTNGSLIFDLMRPENQKYDFFKINISGFELLEQISRSDVKINVLIDVGALMLELSNVQVIEKWLKIRNDAKAGICFDEGNNLVVLSADGKVVPFEISPFRNYLVDCLVYLDDSHTRGTDLKIPKGTVAAVTLGKGVNKDKLMQGCMRMRMLGRGHSVMFFASSEVHNSIQSTTQDKPSGIDVLKWSLQNTITQTSDNFLYWGLQGINYYKRHVIYEKYFKSKDFKKFSTLCEEPELPNIRLLYGGNRKETPIPFIIRAKTSIIQKKMQEFSVNLNHFESLCNSLISHSSSFVSNEKKFAHLLDEEQELELEIEVEVEAEVEKQKISVVKPEKHSLEKDLENWFKSGIIPQDSHVFQKIFKGLGITSLKSQSQPFAWSSKVWLTLDFMRTVNITSGGDHYLKPVRWIGYSEFNKNLVVLSSYEANALIKDWKNGPVKLFWFCPRSRTQQVNLFSMNDSKIPLDLLQNLNVFAGNQYFFSNNEVEQFLKFVGYCPTPRKQMEEKFYLRGMINNNGYVEPRYRNQVFGENNRCDFENDPGELVLKIIEIRNFAVSSKFGHVVDILVYGRRPELNR